MSLLWVSSQARDADTEKALALASWLSQSGGRDRKADVDKDLFLLPEGTVCTLGAKLIVLGKVTSHLARGIKRELPGIGVLKLALRGTDRNQGDAPNP